MKYQTKPAKVSAFQYDGDMVDRWGNPYVPAWAIRALEETYTLYYSGQGELYLKTPNGSLLVPVGSYLVKTGQGEIFSLHPDIFKQIYEKEPSLS